MMLFNYLFEASVLLIILCLVYSAFLKTSTFHHLNRWYLLASLLLSAIIPFVEFPKEVVQQSFSYSLPLIEISTAADTSQNVEVVSFSWFNILWWTYFVMATGFFINLLFKYSKLYFKIQKIYFQKHQGFNLFIGKYDSPAFSFFKYIFIPNLEDEEEKEVLLQHEVKHAKSYHSLDILVIEFFKCLLWFHPLIYWFKNELVAQHEFAIDRELTDTNFSVQQYGQFLINQTQMQPAFLGLTNFFNKSLIKKRIKMMTTKQRKKNMVLNSLLAFSTAVFACLFIVACTQEIPTKSTNLKNDLIIQDLDYPGEFKLVIPKEQERQAEAIDEGLADYIEFLISKNLDKSIIEKKLNKLNNNIEKQLGGKNAINELRSAPKTGTDFFEMAEEMPMFPGGEEALLDFLYTSIQYTEEAKENDIEGLSVAQFIVEKDGSLSNIEILHSIGGGLDEEAMRVIGLMPNWQPGMQDGETVRVEYKLPIKFKLSNDTPTE